MNRISRGRWRVYPLGAIVPGYQIADRIVSDEFNGRSLFDGPTDADAQAIAALPDLIEAAVQAECWLACSRPNDGVTPDEMLRVLRAALAKAGVS